MIPDIFKYISYNQYLADVLGYLPRGTKTKISQEIGFRPAFLSQVLKAKLQFTEEQGILCSRLLRHSPEETCFFLTLIRYARAGHHTLRKHIKEEIERLVKSRKEISSRVSTTESLDQQQKELYYSSWIYSAIHALTSIPDFRTLEALKDRLRLSPIAISEACKSLIEMGLIEEKNGQLAHTSASMHLPKSSPLVANHHINWRLQAIKSLEWKTQDDLHYSSANTLSLEDADVIQEMIRKLIQASDQVLSESPEEEAYCFNIDFFRI